MPKIFKTLILVNCREPRSKIRHQGFHPFAFGPRFPADPLIGGIQFKLGKFKDEFTDKIQLLKCQNTLMNESLMSTVKFPWQQLCMNEFECRRFLYSKKRVSTRRKILSSRVWCRWKYIFIYFHIWKIEIPFHVCNKRNKSLSWIPRRLPSLPNAAAAK